jgi:hypothetical protein
MSSDTPHLSWLDHVILHFGGEKHYHARILGRMLLYRYGFSDEYSLDQIRASVKAIGVDDPYREDLALALFGHMDRAHSRADYENFRDDYGLVGEGALEVFRVYLKIEKQDPDPFGSDQAAETTGGHA